MIVNSQRVSVEDWMVWGARRKSLEFIDYAYEGDQRASITRRAEIDSTKVAICAMEGTSAST